MRLAAAPRSILGMFRRKGHFHNHLQRKNTIQWSSNPALEAVGQVIGKNSDTGTSKARANRAAGFS
jgi:hypothetical protein